MPDRKKTGKKRASPQSPLEHLRKEPTLTFEAGMRVLDGAGPIEGPPMKLAVALWVDAATGEAHGANATVLIDSEVAAQELADALIEALLTPLPGRTALIPGRVRTEDPLLATVLRESLAPLGVEVEQIADASLLTPALATVLQQANGAEPDNDLLDWESESLEPPFRWKVDEALLRPLFEAANAYAALQPWETFEDYPPFRIALGQDGPRTSVRTLYGCVLGAAGELFGIAFYESRAGLRRTIERASPPIDPQFNDAIVDLAADLARRGIDPETLPPDEIEALLGPVVAGFDLDDMMEDTLAVYFDLAEESGPNYLAWLQEHNLPLPPFDGYVTTFMRTRKSGTMGLPNDREVRSMTLALEAITGFLSRHQIDPGDPALEPVKDGIVISNGLSIQVTYPGD